MQGPDAAPITSLYVHVPFCARKCSYCAFYSEAGDRDLVENYVTALIREMELVAHDLRPKTIFFGGGTPSLLSVRQWERILEAMHRFKIADAAEWTVECNPATVSADKAKLLRSGGVNRISMGVQSLDPALLDRLGRIHSREMVFKSWDILRGAGFDNVNLDLMFAIPGQSLDIWRATLSEIMALGPEHLSSYELIYEEDTALFAQMKAGEFDVDEDLACAMYEELVERAVSAGFDQYEVANFAKPARKERPSLKLPGVPAHACWHNVNYWRGGSFYGLGPSATGYARGERAKNVSDTRRYCEILSRGQRPTDTREQLAPLARAGETAAFGLRMVAGWPFDQFEKVTGHDLRRDWAPAMNQLVNDGWGDLSASGFRLTNTGLRFADAAAELFLR